MIYIAYAAALPVLQREWHLSGTAAGSIASAFQVAYALSLMACSELADRIGARAPLARVMAVGLLYGFSALGDSPIYSTAITEVVAL
jgi:MFS family permease